MYSLCRFCWVVSCGLYPRPWQQGDGGHPPDFAAYAGRFGFGLVLIVGFRLVWGPPEVRRVLFLVSAEGWGSGWGLDRRKYAGADGPGFDCAFYFVFLKS